MPKRQMQEDKLGQEKRVVAKTKPTMSFVSMIANRSATLDSGAPNRLEMLGAQSKSADRSGAGKPVARGVKDVNEDNASSSQASERQHPSQQWETSSENVKQTQ